MGGPALYVDIDSGSNRSTFAALDWLFGTKIAREGTLIAYDKWWASPCTDLHDSSAELARANPLSLGDASAHAQISDKYKVSFACAAGSCSLPPDVNECHLNNDWSPLFIVV